MNMPSGPPPHPLGERGTRVAAAGLVFSALFVVMVILLTRSPGVGASDAHISRYYTTDARRSSVVVGLYVIPFAGIAFMWFMGALRSRTVQAAGAEHPMFAAVQLISGAVFVTLLFVGGAAELSVAWAVQSTGAGAFDPASARGLIALSNALMQIFALRAGAVFVGIGTTRGLRSGLFPRWFAIASFVMAAVMLLVSSAWLPIVLVFPVWVTGTSIIVLRRRQKPIASKEA